MKKRKQTNEDLARIIFQEGKIIKREFGSEPYSIVEAFGQRYRIENPGGKGVKITQLERSENGKLLF